MKTLKVALLGLLFAGLTAGVSAQDKKGTDKKADKGTKTQTTTKKQDAPNKDNKGTHLKKDGTPDMRYKENKQATGKDSKGSDTKKSGGTKKGGDKKAADKK